MTSLVTISPDPREQPGDCRALLLAYVDSNDNDECQMLAHRLIRDHCSAIIRNTIRFRLGSRYGNGSVAGGGEEIEDLYGEVVVEVWRRLTYFKASRELSAAIADFRGLVGVISHHACSGYLRRKNPNRCRFAKRVRYHLSSNPRFALWQDGGSGYLCGFRSWRQEPAKGRGLNGRATAAASAFDLFRQSLTVEDAQQIKGVADLLSALFDWVGGPVPVDDAIDVAVGFFGSKELLDTTTSFAGGSAKSPESVPDPSSGIAAELEQREFLVWVWSEIADLPVQQRRALLLNLRDSQGDGVITLFPILRVASVIEIAETLDMPRNELVALWDSLPLDDQTIADRLGLSRRQVINLRRSARERLQRRAKTLGAMY
jgi:DNA-directed RNA polymerase specialized sigma24 family protein